LEIFNRALSPRLKFFDRDPLIDQLRKKLPQEIMVIPA